LNELRETLANDCLEAKISDIIAEIIKVIPLAERGDGIMRNLVTLMSHYLANRDFSSLEQTCRMFADGVSTNDSTVFFDPGFVQEILDSASLLGRENHQNIRSLIRTVGQPFVVPLMERLFAETNRSLRRFWFDCLADLGEMVRGGALERLNDERWFVIRNLIILLRGFSDQDVQRQVRRFVNHSHPKVRLEAMKNLVCYHDPMVDNLLLQDLQSADPARKLGAVQIAEMTSNPEIVHKLLAILDAGGIRDYDLEIKSAVVQTLAFIGNDLALPKLKKILFSVNFLHPGKHAKLKTMIIRSLPRFSAAQVRPLLDELVASGGKNIAALAAETLKGLQGSAS
jgi:HEAT repeat protein